LQRRQSRPTPTRCSCSASRT
jgi:hypothetical protein